MNNLDIDFYKKDRKKYEDAILSSPSRKKLIIAGPGTGKTYIFKTLLKRIKNASGEEGLALTFIRNLVANLRIELAGLAKVSTFHAFCKSRIHTFKNEEFEYYPDLFKIIKKDFEILEKEKFKNENIERCFFGLKNDEVIKSTLEIGDYYNASGHSDSVYRVIKYFEAYPNRIPIYPLILVDEYQDFNFLETNLIEVLSRKSPVLIVGDDDQALYAFK
jgi:superfamily I DNA/RNA helicase